MKNKNESKNSEIHNREKKKIYRTEVESEEEIKGEKKELTHM